MRNNLPVFENEYHLREGDVLVSKTDLYGNITYCNKTFSEVSGYLESELLGQSHNIVRHPDMPQRIFADCWGAISSGESWHGVIKNRRKNGDYYWIDANITPWFENDEWIGYVSLRYKADAEQIAKADKQYAAMRAGKSPPRFSHKPDKNYIGQLQRRLAEKIVAQEEYHDRVEQEQRIAVRYMNKLVELDKLRDSAVQFYLKPAENFSGDLIAMARTPDNRLHLMLADSTGHGLSAALAAMPMIHPFYSMTGKGFAITAIAKEINKKVWESLPVSHFVAAILVSVDTEGRMVEVWSGGCPPPVMLNSAGECEHLFEPRHLALGILPPEQFDASVEYFYYEDSGSSLVMFSDGVIELENAKGEQFGLERLLNTLRVADPTIRLEHTIHEIEAYCGNGSAGNDDIALMMVQCESDRKIISQKLGRESQMQEDQAEGKVVWQLALTLTTFQIRKLDVVPLLLDIVQQIEKDKQRGSEIFMVLSEMFNNALDHGVLKLDSRLKHHEEGMQKYLDEREVRLAGTDTGHIQMNLEKVLSDDGGTFLRIRVKDSGEGFDYGQVARKITADARHHGRGIALLYNVCRSVQFLQGGSEIMVEFDLSGAEDGLMQSSNLSGARPGKPEQ